MLGRLMLSAFLIGAALTGCIESGTTPMLQDVVSLKDDFVKDYVIGPGDQFQVFVWRNTDLSTTVRVRPDGRISVPLVEDLVVAGKTPTKVARDLEEKLSEFIQDAKATIIMIDMVGPVDRQVRVVGEATKPQAVNYRKGMTVLDVMIAAGGLTQFAAGNRSTLTRTEKDQVTTYRLRLADLLKDGDVTANAEVAPGDVVTIPQSWF
ncbi:polysaccharide biosynthesis/export protein [Azospirillaceae bacterium]